MRIRKHDSADTALRDEDILAAAKVSDALAHPVRIRMLRYILTENLARRPVTNKDIVNEFDYAQATVSQHLSKLLLGGLLEVQKRGTSSCYFARVGRLANYTDTLKRIESNGAGADMPDFLRSDFYASGNSVGDVRDELYPEDFETSVDEYQETMHYL